MGRVRLTPGTRFRLEDSTWEILRLLPDRRVAARNLNFGQDRIFGWSEFFSLCLVAGTLRFELKGKATHQDDQASATQYTWADLGQIPEPGRTVAWVRFQIIKPLLGLPKKDRTAQAVKERLEEAHRTLELLVPSDYQGEPITLPTKRFQTLYEWIADFEDSDGDIRALVPRWDKRRAGKKSITPEVFEFIDQALAEYYMTDTHPSVAAVCPIVRQRITEDNRWRAKHHLPTIRISSEEALYMQIYRRIQELDQKKLMASRFGDRAAEKQYDGVKQGLTVERALERVQVDHTKLDLFVVDDEDRLPIGRPTLTFSLDEKTGYPLGIYVGFEPPSYLTVMQCLRHTILPKDYVKAQFPSVVHTWDAYGTPETLVVDNGKEFVSRSLEDSCLQLGIELIYCPPRVPWFKGAIERRFGIINEELLHGLPGTTFSNVAERGEYDPAKNAVISLSALLEMLHIFLIDYYAEHQTGKNRIPARAWDRATREFPPSLPPNRDELTVLLGMYDDRVIQPRGIEFECLFYDSPDLRRLRTLVNRPNGKERVDIKVDPSDLGQIWVYDRFNRRYIAALCTDPDYAGGLSLWKHRVIRRYTREVLKREVDYDALAEAKAQLQVIVDHEYSMTKRTATRQKLARFRGSGTIVPLFGQQLTEARLSSGTTLPVNHEFQQDEQTTQIVPPSGTKRGKKSKDVAEKPSPPPLVADSTDDLDLAGWAASIVSGDD